MRKILLIVAITLCIFQMVVLATAIDMGTPATNRTSAQMSRTYVIKENPANESGTITLIKIYVEDTMTGVEVGTFWEPSSGNLSTRDNEVLGDGSWDTGYHEVAVNLDVTAGDYLGIYYATGNIEADSTASDGFWYTDGDQIPADTVSFDYAANLMISLNGIGATPELDNSIFFGMNF